MKKIIILLLTIFSLSFALESCMVRADKKCKDNMKRIKKMRKSNPGMM